MLKFIRAIDENKWNEIKSNSDIISKLSTDGEIFATFLNRVIHT